MLLFNPKGGATVSAQLFFRYLGVIDEAYNYSRWIHDYRLKVFNGKPNHSPLSCTPALCAAGWVCIRLIRQPLDRVVSSYQFSLQGCSGIAMHWDELRLLKLGERAARMSKQDQAKLCLETTFTEFIQALTMRALKGRKARHTLADDHFMPQHASPEVDKCDGSATHANGTTLVYLVPVEFLDQAVSALGSTTGVVFNATGLNSSHYRKQDQNTMDRNVQLQGLNVPSWPFSRVNAQHPPYELFTSVDANISRRTCCLFRDDIAMYRRACRQPWLQQCAPCVQECSRQLARLRNVCEHGERSVIDESLAFHMGPSMAMRGPLPDAPAPLPDARGQCEIALGKLQRHFIRPKFPPAVYAAILSSSRGFLIGRVGNVEAMACIEILVKHRKPSTQLGTNAGVFCNASSCQATWDHFASSYVEATLASDMLQVVPSQCDTTATFGLKIALPVAPMAFYWGGEMASWLELLQEFARLRTPLLIATPFATSVWRNLGRLDKIHPMHDLSGLDVVDVLRVPQTFTWADPAKMLGGATDWQSTLRQLKRDSTWRRLPSGTVVLLGCGAYGMPLALHAKRYRNFSSMYVGGSLQLLFGIRGARWDTRKTTNDYINSEWTRPLPSELPGNQTSRMIVDQASYW